MHTAQPAIADLAEGLETPVQLIYLSLLVVLLSGAAFIVVRQVLVQREMDERSKVLSELIRTGEATSEDYFELGVVLARRKLFTQALKNYNKAIKLWDGDETELAQVRLLSMLQCNTQCAPSCLLGASRGIDGAAGHRSCCCRCGSALAIFKCKCNAAVPVNGIWSSGNGHAGAQRNGVLLPKHNQAW